MPRLRSQVLVTQVLPPHYTGEVTEAQKGEIAPPTSLPLPESGMKTNLPSRNQPGCFLCPPHPAPAPHPDKYLHHAISVSDQQPTVSCLTTQKPEPRHLAFPPLEAPLLFIPQSVAWVLFPLQEDPKVLHGRSHSCPWPSSFILPPNSVPPTEVRGRFSHL